MIRSAATLYVRVTPATPAGTLVRSLRSEVARRGWQVAGEYVDVDHREVRCAPEKDRLVADIRRGRVEVVVVESLGHLGRSLVEIVAFVEDLRVRGIDLVVVRDAIDTTGPGGTLALDAIAALARAHRDLVGERVRVALDVARRRGSRIGRPPVAVDLDRALVLREQGKSIREVARALGVGPTTVHRALRAATPRPPVLAAA